MTKSHQWWHHSIANSSLFPTSLYLHSNSTQILALKKTGFFSFSDSKKNFQKIFYKIIMQLFSADAIVFSKKKFEPENMKKLP